MRSRAMQGVGSSVLGESSDGEKSIYNEESSMNDTSFTRQATPWIRRLLSFYTSLPLEMGD